MALGWGWGGSGFVSGCVLTSRQPRGFATFVLLGFFTTLTYPRHQGLYDITNEELFDSASDLWFERMSEKELEMHWSQDDATTVQEKILHLSTQTIVVPVQVRLVGFTSAMALSVSKEDLDSYIEALELPSSLKLPLANPGANESNPALTIKLRHSIRISTAPSALSRKISLTISEALRRSPESLSDSASSSVGFRAVVADQARLEEILNMDYDHQGHSGYIIYVLNPSPPLLRPGGTGHAKNENIQHHLKYHNYTWGYVENIMDEREGGSNRYYRGICPYTDIGMGRGDGRYVWVDLRAEVVERRPKTERPNIGSVTSWSLPRVQDIERRGLRPGTTGNTDSTGGVVPLKLAKAWFLSRLATLVGRIVNQAIIPNPAFYPRYPSRDVQVEILLIYDDESVPPDWLPSALQRYKSARDHLAATLPFPRQKVRGVLSGVPLSSCDTCRQAISESVEDGGVGRDGKGLNRAISMNSTVLARGFGDFLQSRWKGYYGRAESYALIVIAGNWGGGNGFLIDNREKSMAFERYSIVVESYGADAHGYECTGFSTNRHADGSIYGVGSMRETVLGIPTPHQGDLLLATSASKNGPFPILDMDGLESFSEADTAWRVAIISEFAASSAQVVGSLKRFVSSTDDNVTSLNIASLPDIAGTTRYIDFVRRWNVYKFKVGVSFRYLSHLNFHSSLALARSAHHDVREIRMILDDFYSSVQPSRNNLDTNTNADGLDSSGRESNSGTTYNPGTNGLAVSHVVAWTSVRAIFLTVVSVIVWVVTAIPVVTEVLVGMVVGGDRGAARAGKQKWY